MFQNKRFLTRGVQAEIPIELQLFLWHCIDNLPEERDYFQVFKLDVANGKQNLILLFNSPTPATAQKPLPSIRHICGLGASVGCERVERTFNTPRLKAQICLIEGNGFACSLSNELNSNSVYILTLYFFCAILIINKKGSRLY